jgi:hypothetical protein
VRTLPAALTDAEAPEGARRAALAGWLTDPANPLTARVMVNRVWSHHFGAGIVGTPSNYGQLGDRPGHPELLDYLAARFVENGWSLKALHREIMLSAAYRSSTAHDEKNAKADPENRLLWRANRIERLDAESLRDAILAVSGKLENAIGGPPAEFGVENHRRAIYGTVSRTMPDRSMALFDFPDPNQASEKRAMTQGPMQRLYFMNSPFVIEQARALAERIASEAPGGDEAKIPRVYELLYGRPPNAEEQAIGLQYLRQEIDAWPKYAQALLGASEFWSVN